MVTHYAYRFILRIGVMALGTLWIFLMFYNLVRPNAAKDTLMTFVVGCIGLYLLLRAIFLKHYVTVTPKSLIIRDFLFSKRVSLKNIKKVTVYDDEDNYFQKKYIVFKLSWWRNVRVLKAFCKSPDWPNLVNWAATLQPQQ